MPVHTSTTIVQKLQYRNQNNQQKCTDKPEPDLSSSIPLYLTNTHMMLSVKISIIVIIKK